MKTPSNLISDLPERRHGGKKRHHADQKRAQSSFTQKQVFPELSFLRSPEKNFQEMDRFTQREEGKTEYRRAQQEPDLIRRGVFLSRHANDRAGTGLNAVRTGAGNILELLGTREFEASQRGLRRRKKGVGSFSRCRLAKTKSDQMTNRCHGSVLWVHVSRPEIKKPRWGRGLKGLKFYL